jgi:hypothetical protein
MNLRVYEGRKRLEGELDTRMAGWPKIGENISESGCVMSPMILYIILGFEDCWWGRLGGDRESGQRGAEESDGGGFVMGLYGRLT